MGDPGCLSPRLRLRGELGVCSQALAVPHRSPVPWAALRHGRARSPARRFRHHGGSTTAAQRKPRRSRLAGAAETGARPPGGAALATSAAGVEPRSRPRRSGERVSVGRRCSRRPSPHRAAEPPSRLRVAIARRRGGSSALWTGRRRLDEGNGSVDEGR